MIILGAGLAGCIAAHLFPGSQILEAGGKDNVGAHKAVLRFRSDAVSRLTGIPFRKVRVYKAVVYMGQHYCAGVPAPLMNAYSQKVSGRIAERSIMNLELAERWIAPDDFHAQMVARLPVRFNVAVERVTATALWRNNDADGEDRTDEPVLSTVPLPAMLTMAGLQKEFSTLQFQRLPIHVGRWNIPDCDVYQTNYYPGTDFGGVYRASITGKLLIVESMDKDSIPAQLKRVCESFGLDFRTVTNVVQHTQPLGKITPLPDAIRRAIILRLTRHAQVFSFGRFATWRNILLDDLPEDAEQIRALIRMTDYEHTLVAAR